MIHIMRENETLEDIAFIYGVDKEKILSKNPPFTIFHKNCAVYIPLEYELYFTEEEISTAALGKVVGTDEEFLLRINGIEKSCVIPKNTRVKVRKREAIKKEKISCIYRTEDVNSDFVNIDRNQYISSKIYLDCYNISGNSLDLAGDYPAINACKVNNIDCGFYLDDLKRFADEDIILQLKHDLRYKSYTEVLLNVKNISETESCKYLTDCFRNIGLNVSVKADENGINALNYEDYDTLYYSSRRNIFDFSSFTDIVSSLMDKIPVRYLGYDMKMCVADIHRENMKITYPDIRRIKEIHGMYTPEISFDDISRLCFFRYEENGIHNVIYEDLRTLYAKANYLRDCGMEKFLINGMNEAASCCI